MTTSSYNQYYARYASTAPTYNVTKAKTSGFTDPGDGIWKFGGATKF